MKLNKIHHTLPLFLTALLTFAPLATGQNAKLTQPASAIRITPPAPVFDEATRRAEVMSRRARVAEKVGKTNALVLFSAEPKVYTGDVDYEYRQENNFYYLTNLRQQDAVLVILPGIDQTREILFMPRRDPRTETWTGHMYSPQEAVALSGIEEIWERKYFETFIRALAEGTFHSGHPDAILQKPKTEEKSFEGEFKITGPLLEARKRGVGSLLMLAPPKERREGAREWTQESRFANAWERDVKNFPIAPAWAIFGGMRLRKSPMEQRLLQHAIDITTEGLGRAMMAAASISHEYEAEAEVEYTFKRRGADYWGYPSIVGCGQNATTLHYWESRGKIAPNDLLLMDTGAEFDHYTADITRTFPVSGRFSPAQTDIYNLVLLAQENAMSKIKHGGSTSDVHKGAEETIRDGLLRLGLITDRNSDQYRTWFMHGTSHWLGMNVHDVGDYKTPLAEGMIFTIEPGIYVRPDALDNLPDTPENRKFKEAVRPAFEKYKNIGVRIEDDILITSDGWRNMSVALPRTIPDIEAFIAKARSERLTTNASRRSGDWLRRFTGDDLSFVSGTFSSTRRGGFVRAKTSRSLTHDHAE